MKRRTGKKYVSQALALLLSLSLTGSLLAGCGKKEDGVTDPEEAAAQGTEEDTDALLTALGGNAGDAGSGSGKEETVWLFADNTGQVTSAIVSGWLKNPDGEMYLTDVTDAVDIVNVKGEETFRREGDRYIWQADGRDIYYQGTTGKEAPVTERITYSLDGREVAAEELAGQSGHVTIRFDYENHLTRSVMISGEEEKISVPFAVVTGMILNDRFTNVSVENGRLISDGRNQIVVGFALPGLKESLKLGENGDSDLDLAEDVNVPDYVEISADVEDFELDMTLTVASASADLSFDEALDFSDLDEQVDTLEDASGQLMDGSSELAEGIVTLRDSLGEFSDGMNSLRDGIVDYTDGAAELGDGIGEVWSGAGELDDGAGELADGAAKLDDGIQTLRDGISSARNGANQLADGINGSDGAKSGAAALADGAARLKAGFEGERGALAGSRAVADGVAQVGGMMKQIAGMEDMLIEKEAAILQGIYGAAGQPIGQVTRANIDRYVAGVPAILQAMEQSLGGAVTAALDDAERNGYEEGYMAGQEEAERSLEESLRMQREEDEKNRQDEENVKTKKPVSDISGSGQDGDGTQEDKEQNGKGETPDSGKEETGQGNTNKGNTDKEEMNGENTNRGDTDKGNTDKGNTDQGGTDSGSHTENREDTGSGQDSSGSDDRDKASDGGTGNSDKNAQDQNRNGGEERGTQGQEATAMEVSMTPYAMGKRMPAANPLSAHRQTYTLLSLSTQAEEERQERAGQERASQESLQKLIALEQAAGSLNALDQLRRTVSGMGSSSSADQLAALQELVNGAAALADGVEQLYQGASQLADGTAQLNEGMEKLGSGAGELAGGMGQLSDGSDELKEGSEKLRSGSGELKDGTQKLKDGAAELQDGAGELTGHSSELVDGAAELREGTDKIVDGVKELDEGAGELADGMAEFDEEGISRIADAYHTDVKSLTDRVKAVSDAGKEYDNFSGKAENTDSSVKFILKTEPVKKAG